MMPRQKQDYLERDDYMSIKSKLKRVKGKLKKTVQVVQKREEKNIDRDYLEKYYKYSFKGYYCDSFQQYEATITRLYHTIEKGLSYEDKKYRPGFGKENIELIVTLMESYVINGYSTREFFYQTALSCLHAYIAKNAAYGYTDNEIEERIQALWGQTNDEGGAFRYTPLPEEKVKRLSFKGLMEDRHSIRHFSDQPVEIEKIIAALNIAQHTPSACNRQGWSARIITDKKKITQVLNNQNGNNGFGQEIDKLIIVTGDLRYYNRDRETYQVYIDSGMYAANILNALHYNHIGTIPLSAALKPEQEKVIRESLQIHEAEVLILIIGVGNYPAEAILTAKSARHEARYRVY